MTIYDPSYASNASYTHPVIFTGANQVTNTTWSSSTGPAGLDAVNKLDIIEDRLNVIEDRLLILNVEASILEKYPALKEAYDAYKIIEALIGDSQ